ncbi:6-phosphofructokinase 1 [Lentibacillus persicus]|uniref:Pyrophosphate--fructose 6-phosphate 1-phosphotransferase n=1 Tax=Lentibacillus persicus TaxID=640948 RepID=A0A1I2A1N5_9BACI|nr:diphosphate--fructose-6-phosphate 1-phosphotransferase [Lentibacillus persicus]SFE37895.1 6-phosphofructokinase 1 [Lentibacillus persicus]
MKHIAIGQAGGPTAVVNATLAGFVRALNQNCSLTFIMNGYEGLVNDYLLHADDDIISEVIAHEKVPGAALGAGRYPLSEEQIAQSVKTLRKFQIDTLVFIGGNGTMEALAKIKAEADRHGYPLQTLGLPKTVDNDLAGTDHSPGFGSAAKYVAHVTRDMGRDLLAMTNFEQVRIVETMGRNAGWLAAAAGLLKEHAEDGPHFIGLPEKPLNPDFLFNQISESIKCYGAALIVVSEGVRWEKGKRVKRDQVNGRPILGGISQSIEQTVKQNMDVVVRSELLGMNQRSCAAAVSPTDFHEAVQIGKVGAKWLFEGASDVMVALQRADGPGYAVDFLPVSLQTVVQKGERQLPDRFSDDLNAYNEWLRPLVGERLPVYPPPLQRRHNNGHIRIGSQQK